MLNGLGRVCFGDVVRKYVRQSPSINKRSPQLGGQKAGPTIQLTPCNLPGPRSPNTPRPKPQELGVSTEQLRTMIRSHVVDRDEDLTNVPATTFQPSDLLILRLLAGKPPLPAR